MVAVAVVSVGGVDVATTALAVVLVEAATVLITVDAAALVCVLAVAAASRVAKFDAKLAGALRPVVSLLSASVALMVFAASAV